MFVLCLKSVIIWHFSGALEHIEGLNATEEVLSMRQPLSQTAHMEKVHCMYRDCI